MKRFLPILIIGLLVIPGSLYARWIKDKVLMPVEATGTVEFSHYNHLEAVGKNCPTCHNSIYDIIPEKNPEFTMADMEKGKACGACHNGDKAFNVTDDCTMCHPTRDITTETDAGPATFPHEVHTEMYGCGDCHSDMFVPSQAKNPVITMDQMAEGESCGACHDGDTAFSVTDNCDSCHEM